VGAAIMMDVAAQTDSPEGGTGPARRWMSPQRTATVAAAAAAAARYVPSGRRQNRLHQYCCVQYTEPRHTHTHPFNGPMPGTTQVGRYQKAKTNPDFTGARDSEWQWHQLGHMQVCTLLQTDNHASTSLLSFFTVQMPFLSPNQQRQSTEGNNTEPRQTEVI